MNTNKIKSLITSSVDTLVGENNHLKNPPKYTMNMVLTRITDKLTNPLTDELIVSEEVFQSILDGVIDGLVEMKRFANSSQGDGYNVWMKDLKWFLDPKNENGFGGRIYRRCKETQKLFGWTDEQYSEVSKCFDKITLDNGNHIYRGVDSNLVYRDNTCNLGKVTKGLGDNKKDVKRGDLDVENRK